MNTSTLQRVELLQGRKKNRPCKGFSLIEIMFAFIIVGVSILPMISFILEKYKETPIIESNRFAQERGYDIMLRVMEEVPFEMLKASPSSGQPGSIVAQSAPANAEWTSTYAQTLLTSIFSGSTLLTTTTIVDKRGINYKMLLEVFDIYDPSPTAFDGVTYSDTKSWRELYFDFYRLPDFYNQADWYKASDSDTLTSTLTTPYRLTVGSYTWGPNERKVNGAAAFGKSDLKGGFPRDQKDRTKPWTDWDKLFNGVSPYYCTMKKLRLTITWNLARGNWSNPDATDGRPNKINLIAFKSNISKKNVEQ